MDIIQVEGKEWYSRKDIAGKLSAWLAGLTSEASVEPLATSLGPTDPIAVDKGQFSPITAEIRLLELNMSTFAFQIAAQRQSLSTFTVWT